MIVYFSFAGFFLASWCAGYTQDLLRLAFMKSKLIVAGIVIALLVVALWLGNKSNEVVVRPERKISKVTQPKSQTDDRGFRRLISRLEYSVHARCRMKCRKITQDEVKDIMRNGTINYSKSDLNDAPCPSYALEGVTQADRQHVRIVFAQCAQKTKVVTCIDLERDYDCVCK